jgi:RNA polymerase sigma factor (sigma-70 family)
MNAQSTSTEFRQHERVLWRVLVSLSKAGFFVPLEDARDLFHDFYVEAWQGLTARHNPAVANFTTYVAGAFHRFARRRAIQLDQSRRRLIQLEEAGELKSPELEPSVLLERKQLVGSLQDALASLTGLERTLLVEHFGEERKSERDLAARHSLTRHSVRATLASALEKVTEQVRRPSQRDAIRKPQTPLHYGTRSKHKTATSRSRRPSIAGHVSAGAPRTTTNSEIKGATMNEYDQQAIRKALLTGDESAFQYLAQNAERLRAELSESDDFQLGDPSLDYLRENSQHLLRLYEVLLSDEEPSELSEVEQAIEQERTDSAVEVGEAFDLLTADLPFPLLEWEHWFGNFRVEPDYVAYLRMQTSVLHGGRHALRLTRFGLTPDSVAGALRGFQLLFDQQLSARKPRQAFDTEESLLVVNSDRAIELALEHLVAQVSTGPFLPPLSGMPQALTDWTLNLLKERPYCVLNYVFDMQSHGRPAAIALPDWEHVTQPDLRAVWVRPAPQSSEVVAYA